MADLFPVGVPGYFLGKCMYGYSNAANMTKRTKKTTPCFHSYYEDMMEHIARFSSNLSQSIPVGSGFHNVTANDGQLKLKWLTMVRDPYDRLVSLFHYSKRDYLDHDFTKEQEKYLESDDMESWMQSLTKPKHHYISHQYMRLNYTSLDGAISLIEGEDPTMFTLINECFEASLRLLMENFWLSDSTETETVDPVTKVVESGKLHNVGKYANRSVHQEDPLRAKARVCFQDDFEFFDHAVRQFQLMMQLSVEKHGGDSTHFDSCRYYTKEGGNMRTN
eukprot:CAMPEP_0198147862 /NCGR_PEP_ID=MMETSP1443-20131203/38213_1 /TAXON_ID=186043 /ORGANISM="Entomoneis sp., Strain CCMP2396" /LENGTH=276 /DNA_ID=CAMNT_0043812365 /DNA_START=104 /DNA_END=934 /DNA_ORIENTATION=-